MRRIFFCLIALLAIGCSSPTVMAQPAQRIIIGFEPALTEQTRPQMEQMLESLLHQPPHKVASSHDQRWVLELPDRLNLEQLQSLLKQIEDLPNVKYAEADSLLQAQ